MPAEWAPQSAVWLSWPHNYHSWPGKFRPIPYLFSRIVTEISRRQPVRINCDRYRQPRAIKLCEKNGADMSRVTFYDHPTNDAWCRDHGPIFVKHTQTGEVALTDWAYNAWGDKYPPYDLDNQIPPGIARALGLRRFENDMVLEGGSIDVNGDGLLLTSEQCLLNKNRNPRLSREQIEQNLRDYLGVTDILWLGEGIIGDDTDGHIDDMTRFYKPDGFITCVEPNTYDKNHALLAANLERLRGFRTPAGGKFDIVELPMPKPFGFQRQRVPASYANFLIINDAVLVPTFRQNKRDREACAIIATCFPNREIVPIDCYHLIWGLGTLHCISQQQPA
ncbi:agmatine deiminase family protein [Geminisphaera colitermitum]|uniref:agmatine deiminase family protein n=1 Tax=Geminisphaera colitermitum TaxID=1148786 RepID=UPI0005B8DAE2|nr:agmatine deiminase family protein [Geminisphaera colitermitum]